MYNIRDLKILQEDGGKSFAMKVLRSSMVTYTYTVVFNAREHLL